MKNETILLENQIPFRTMHRAVEQPGRNLDQLTIAISLQRFIRRHPRRLEGLTGGHFAINGILQERRVITLAHKAERFNAVARC